MEPDASVLRLILLPFLGLVLACLPTIANAQPAPAVNIQVTTVSGETVSGQLVGLTDGQWQLTTTGGETQSIPLGQLIALTRPDATASLPVVAQVGLAGGSRISIDSVLSDGKTVTLQRRGQDPITVPIQQLRWVRYRSPAVAVDAQWLGLVDQARSADSLVVRRPGDVIDEVSGAVVSFDATTVSFNLDGQTMQAPVSRLEGFVLAPLGDSQPKRGAVTIETTDGSRWIADRLTAGEATVSAAGGAAGVDFTLANDLSIHLAWDRIRRIELAGSTEPLAGQQPAASEFQPALAIGLNSELSRQWLGPQVVDGTDLQMQANSHAEYHVPDGFTSLTGSVDFAPEVEFGGLCLVRIQLDDQVVWEQTLDVAESSPRGLDLPLAGGRRVRLIVDSGGDGPVGDSVRFRQPRFVK